jgi:hypothetical protein
MNGDISRLEEDTTRGMTNQKVRGRRYACYYAVQPSLFPMLINK